MQKWLNLDDFITPEMIQLLYWVFLIIAVVYGIASMAYLGFFIGLVRIVFGVIIARVASELIMVLFNINDSLKKIAEKE